MSIYVGQPDTHLAKSLARARLHRILKITGNFLQLLSAFLVNVFKKVWFSLCSLVYFLSIYLYKHRSEKTTQSTGNGCRNSHVILSIFMQPGPGHCIVFLGTLKDETLSKCLSTPRGMTGGNPVMC